MHRLLHLTPGRLVFPCCNNQSLEFFHLEVEVHLTKNIPYLNKTKSGMNSIGVGHYAEQLHQYNAAVLDPYYMGQGIREHRQDLNTRTRIIKEPQINICLVSYVSK